MKTVTSLDDFIKYNSKDLNNILWNKFRNFVMGADSLEDLRQDIFIHFFKNKIIEKFDSNRGVMFSTYFYRCLQNFLFGYKSRYLTSKKPEMFKTMISFEDWFENNSNSSCLEKKDNHCPETGVFIKHLHRSLLKKHSTRRSHLSCYPHNVLEGFLVGKRDKDISDETGMTIAGVGSLKRKIRKEIIDLKGGGFNASTHQFYLT